MNKRKHKTVSKDTLRKREATAFHRRIWTVFCDMGFVYVPTQGKEFVLGNRKIEIDAAYIKDNIILLCEDTIENGEGTDHVIKKNEAAEKIAGDRNGFLSWFSGLSEATLQQKNEFGSSRIKVYYLYFSKYHEDWSSDDIKRFKHLRLIPVKVLEYFRWIVQCLKLSAIGEFYRFMGLQMRDVGAVNNSSEKKSFDASIVYPTQFIGGDEKLRVVSFMISAEDMLQVAYVLRRDGWENPDFVYQRLVDKNKIRKIRQFLCENKTTFYNNIIAILPNNVKVENVNGETKGIFDVMDDTAMWNRLLIPKDFNTIGIIDGQHRVFAYHEGGVSDTLIAPLRKKLHLLVTGIVFPEGMPEVEKARIQSKIFLDINCNAKPVSANLLLHIRKMQAPLEDVSLAQDVVDRLNKIGMFRGQFQDSDLSTGKIHTASIIKFALRYLVSINPAEGKGSFISNWNGDVDALKHGNDVAKHSYVEYCANNIGVYFGGVKKAFQSEWAWSGGDTLLPSVVTINGFLLALSKILLKEPFKDVEYYCEKFKKVKVEFSTKKFPYRSSQYHKFARQIVNEGWGIDCP